MHELRYNFLSSVRNYVWDKLNLFHRTLLLLPRTNQATTNIIDIDLDNELPDDKTDEARIQVSQKHSIPFKSSPTIQETTQDVPAVQPEYFESEKLLQSSSVTIEKTQEHAESSHSMTTRAKTPIRSRKSKEIESKKDTKKRKEVEKVELEEKPKRKKQKITHKILEGEKK